jgi:hypothetical protein
MCSGRRGKVRPHHPADPEPFRGRVRPHHRGQLQEAGRHRRGDLPPGHTRHCRPGGKFLSSFWARGVHTFLQRESERGIGYAVLYLYFPFYGLCRHYLTCVQAALCASVYLLSRINRLTATSTTSPGPIQRLSADYSQLIIHNCYDNH